MDLNQSKGPRIYLNRETDIEGGVAATGNNSFIILLSKNHIKIFFIDELDTKKIELKEEASSAKMHPFYKTIFLTLSKKEIKIWEISKSPKDCKFRVKIKGHTKNIIGADFCKDVINDKLLASYSEDNAIKIWKLDKAFCINNISTIELVDKIELFSKYLYYLDKKNNIYLYDNQYLKDIAKRHFENEIIDFVVIKEKKIIILNEGSILIYNLENDVKQLKLTLDSYVRQMIYDNKLEILYLFSDKYIYIINKNYKLFLKDKIKNSRVILLDNRINDQYICANFLIDSSEFYNFESEELYDEKKIVSLKEPQNNFWENCIQNISDIINISWDENFIDEKERLSKKYLNIDEIKRELDNNNYKINLDQKKNDVELQLKNYSKKTDVKEEYLALLKMVIKDNTNKELIKIYLKFLESNQTQLQKYYNDNYETYEEESKYYSILFLQDNKIDNHLNKLFQKELFIQLLKEIVNINKETIDKFTKDIDDKLKKFIIFNQPITYNNQELYWHRNIFIIYFSIKNLIKNKNKLDLMKSTIEEVFIRGILNKDYILKDKALLTSIIALIAIPQEFVICQFNLNLIETMDTQYKEQLNNNCLNEDTYEYNGVKLDNASKRCYKNFKLNVDEKKIKKYFPFQEEELYNYKSYLKYFKDFIDIDKINEFLSKIFCSNTFKQAFAILYPENFSYPFKSEEDALKFIKIHFNYIPFKSSTTNAITDKLSLESYYFLKLKNIFLDGQAINNYRLADFVKIILYHSSIIKTNTHEINHEFYNMLFLHSNGYYPVETPRKKKN